MSVYYVHESVMRLEPNENLILVKRETKAQLSPYLRAFLSDKVQYSTHFQFIAPINNPSVRKNKPSVSGLSRIISFEILEINPSLGFGVGVLSVRLYVRVQLSPWICTIGFVPTHVSCRNSTSRVYSCKLM